MYLKKYTDASNASYQIYRVYDNGRKQAISEEQDLFIRYLDEHPDYVIPEEPWTPPPDPYASMDGETRVFSKVRNWLANAGYSQEIISVLTLNKLAGRNPEEFDQMNDLRLYYINKAYEEESQYNNPVYPPGSNVNSSANVSSSA